jgi:hypothetical protein
MVLLTAIGDLARWDFNLEIVYLLHQIAVHGHARLGAQTRKFHGVRGPSRAIHRTP